MSDIQNFPKADTQREAKGLRAFAQSRLSAGLDLFAICIGQARMKIFNYRFVILIKSIIYFVNFVALTFLLCISTLEASTLPPRHTVNESIQFNDVRLWVAVAINPSKVNLMENPFSNWSGCIVEFFSFISTKAESMTKDETKKKGDETDNNTLLHWLFPVATFVFDFTHQDIFTM